MSMTCKARPETLKLTSDQQAKQDELHELARKDFAQALAAAQDRVAERAGAGRPAGRSAVDQRAAAARQRLAEAKAEAEAAEEAAAAEGEAAAEEEEAAAEEAAAGKAAASPAGPALSDTEDEAGRGGAEDDDAEDGGAKDGGAKGGGEGDAWEGDDEEDQEQDSDAEQSDEARRTAGINELLKFKDKRMKRLYNEWADRRLTQVGKTDPPSQEEDLRWAAATYDSEQERLAKKDDPPAKKRKLGPGEVGPVDAAWGRGPRVNGWTRSRLSLDEIVQKEHEMAATAAARKDAAVKTAVPAKPVRAVAKGMGKGKGRPTKK